MHERAIEKGIALAEHHDVLARAQQTQQMRGTLGVKGAKNFIIARITERDFGGDRIFHCKFAGLWV